MEEKLQLLIIEDVRLDAELVVRELTQRGMRVDFECVDSETALRHALTDKRHDVILSDYSLPQFDGMRALIIARQVDPDIPFIFVSGTIGEERAIEALRRGATDYILKDNLARLAPSVERALQETSNRNSRRNAEQMLRDIVATSQDWIWQLDSEGRFTFSSAAVTTVLGYHPEDLIGQKFDRYLHDEDARHAATLLPSHDGEKAALTGVVARWRHMDGQYRWLERNSILISDAGGKVTGYRGIDRDITARREQQIRFQRLSRSHRMLSSINSTILRARKRADLLNEACRIAVEQGGYDRAMVSQIDSDRSVLRPIAWAGASSAFFEQTTTPLGTAPADPADLNLRALRTGAAVISDDQAAGGIESPFNRELNTLNFKTCVVLPLAVDGLAFGTMMLNARETGMLDAAELRVLHELSANIGYALQYFEKEDAVHFLSYFDPITGLAKRTLFCERLARTLGARAADECPVAVVVFDVQHLSLVNDSVGRELGDRLLEKIAERMGAQFGETKHLAHFGGGTFAVVVCEQVDSAQNGRMLQTEINRIFFDPFTIDGRELRASIRCGFAYFPGDGRAANEVVQGAEAALRRAKESGSPFVLHGLIRKEGDSDRLVLESRLVGALERAEFELHYQPLISVADGNTLSVEALLRWREPRLGLVMPGAFVALLETLGLMVDVGEWVIQQAARDCRNWRSLGYSNIRCSVNVSALQLREKDFVDRVLSAIGAGSADSSGIDLEITESMLMHDLESSTQKLGRLRHAGLKISIDDFGTGYSSLRHLASLPVDSLKIDRSFVQGIVSHPNDKSVISTIINLAHSFGMSTVAEGVETEQQLQLLRQLNCDQAQGYLFSEPLIAQSLAQFLKSVAK